MEGQAGQEQGPMGLGTSEEVSRFKIKLAGAVTDCLVDANQAEDLLDVGNSCAGRLRAFPRRRRYGAGSRLAALG
jgi:hypothetical protein